jgi:hypothetical protein
VWLPARSARNDVDIAYKLVPRWDAGVTGAQALEAQRRKRRFDLGETEAIALAIEMHAKYCSWMSRPDGRKQFA